MNPTSQEIQALRPYIANQTLNLSGPANPWTSHNKNPWFAEYLSAINKCNIAGITIMLMFEVELLKNTAVSKFTVTPLKILVS